MPGLIQFLATETLDNFLIMSHLQSVFEMHLQHNSLSLFISTWFIEHLYTYTRA